jgi:anti-anti-sigma factor
LAGPRWPGSGAEVAKVMDGGHASSAARLEVSVVVSPSWVIADVAGEADASTVDQLRDALIAQLPPDVRRVIVDLSGLCFIGSLGVHVLLDAARILADRGGSLVLISPAPIVARILSLTGADELIPVYPGLAEAQRPQ